MKIIKFIIGLGWGLLIIAGVGLRVTNLSQTPPGLYIDEASIGENAYQISTTGKDEWGVKWPVFFKAFGEYKNPLFIYSVAMGFKLFGVSIKVLRLTAAMWGLAAVFITGLAVKEITKSKTVAALMSLILLFLPWHFHSSRVAFEAITMPFFMSLMIYGWAKKRLWLTYASIGGMFYSYTSARLFAPLFAGYLILSNINNANWKKLLVGIGILGLCWLPAARWEYNHPGSLIARYAAVKARPALIVKTYVKQFGINLWLGKGDSNLRHTPGKGLLLVSWLPLWMIGLWQVAKRLKVSNNARFVSFCLITAPAAAALTMTDPNGLRMIHAIPVIVIILSYGVKCLLEPRYRLVLVSILAAGSIETGFFLNHYFKNYTVESSWWYDTPFVEALPNLWSRNLPVVVHHYLIGNGHQVTQNFICRTRTDCKMIAIYSDKSQIPNGLKASHLYFDADCRKYRIKVDMISNRACIRQN